MATAPQAQTTRIYTSHSPLESPALFLTRLWADMWGCRELAWRLFVRNIQAQTRQSFLGLAWLFLMPLLTTVIWVLLQSSGVIAISDTGVPYPAFVMTGTLLWQAFVDAVQGPLRHLQASRVMLTKLQFPREAPILAGIIETFCFTTIRLVMLVGIFLYYDIALTPYLLLFPLGFIGLVICGLAIGVWLTPIGLLYLDINRIIQFGAQLGMYMAPVIAPRATDGTMQLIHTLNPLTYLIETGRNLILGGPLDYWLLSCLMLAIFALLLLIGWFFCRLAMPVLVERMGM